MHAQQWILCAAVACRARAAEEGWSFAKMATQAYLDRVDLSAHGFYATPEITGWFLGLSGVL